MLSRGREDSAAYIRANMEAILQEDEVIMFVKSKEWTGTFTDLLPLLLCSTMMSMTIHMTSSILALTRLQLPTKGHQLRTLVTPIVHTRKRAKQESFVAFGCWMAKSTNIQSRELLRLRPGRKKKLLQWWQRKQLRYNQLPNVTEYHKYHVL